MHYRHISQFPEVIFRRALKGCASQVSESEFKDLEDGETSRTFIYRTNFFLTPIAFLSQKRPRVRSRIHAIHII